MKKLIFALCLVLLSGAAWGQVDPFDLSNKLTCEQQCEMRCTFNGKENPECYSACLHACIKTNRWADSRYRLEKNEVTGRYRVTEKKYVKDAPEVIFEWVEVWDGWVKTGKHDIGHHANEQEAIEVLDKIRSKEQADKAWRPIK